MGIDAVIVAGDGRASRKIFKKNKALLDVAGKPMIRHIVETLQGCKAIDQVVVVGPKERFEEVIGDTGVHIVQQKRSLASELGRAGIKAFPLFYEEFCRDKRAFLKGVFEHLENPVSDNEIEEALRQGTVLEKVHSDDISDFVTNHEEVMTKFGDRYFSW